MAKIAIHDLPQTDADLNLEQKITNVGAASIYGGFRLRIGENFELRIGGEQLQIDINYVE